MAALVGRIRRSVGRHSRRRRRPGDADGVGRALGAHRALGRRPGDAAGRRSRHHGLARGFGWSWRRRTRRRREDPMMELLGTRVAGHRGRACDSAGPARAVRGDGALRPQLHQGAALDGGDLLRPQAHAHRRKGRARHGRLPRRPRRRRAARAGAREGRIPLAQHHLDPAEDLARLHQGRRGGHRGGGRQREDRERRCLAAQRRRALPRHDHRQDQGRHLPDARRPPARDSRHAHRRGDQRRPSGVRPEDDRRGRRRSQEDGRQHRHPHDPADQRRAGLPRRARQEAHGRSQARRDHRRGAGARATR